MDNNATQLQLLRGNSASNDAYTGRAGELTVNTTDWSLRVHDGVTVGGYVVSGTGGPTISSSYAKSASIALTASYALNATDVFPYTGSAIVSGSLTVTGSINASSFTGSLLGTSSWARSASVAISSSYSISSSFATSASYALTSPVAISASYALTSSFAISASRASSSATVDVLSGGSTTGLGIYSGSFFGTASSAVTASFALNATPGFPFSGSAIITGSLLVSSSGITLIGRGLTGSVFGTSSWAQSSSVAISSSFATSASYSLSSSFAVSASRASSSAAIDVLSGGSTTGLGIYSGSFSGSFFGTLSGSGGGSGVGFPFSGSAVITGSLLVSSSGITLIGAGLTGSVSGSLIGTASYAQNSNLLDGLDSTVFATTGSNSFTGIQSINNNTNSTTWTNGALIVSGGVGIGRDVNISGSLNVRGVLTVTTMSTQYITSSQLNVGTSKITLNDDDNVRFAGISIFDSGSTSATASIYWDSLNHKFIYENISGEPYTSGMFIAGPVNTGTLGNEVGLTVGRVPVASGTDHIDSRTASSSIRVDFPSRLTHIEAGLNVTGSVSASSYSSSISNAVGFLGTASFAVSASRASSSAVVDVISGGSTTGLGIYSGSFSGSFFGALTGTGGGSGVGFPFSGSAVITGSLLVSSSGITLIGAGLTGSISGSLTGTASFATSASFAPVGPGTVNSVALFNASNTVSSSIIFQSGGNVGIGTTTPGTKLTVNGGATISGSSTIIGSLTVGQNSNSSTAARIDLTAGGNGFDSLIDFGYYDTFDANIWNVGRKGSTGAFFISNQGSGAEVNAITITGATNNVGIGISSSINSKLQIQGNVSASSYTSSISNAVGFLGTASWAQSASNATSVAPNSVALGTDTTGNYVGTVTQGKGITVSGTAGEGSTHTITLGSSSINTVFANISGSGNWFTVARRTNASTGRGISEVYIHGIGGDATPSVLKILWNVDWSGNGTIRIDSYTGNLPISNIRSTYTGSTGVSELEIQSTTSTNATIYSTVTDYSVANGNTTPIVTASTNLPTTATLPIGYFYDGVIFTSASTNVGIGTTNPQAKLQVNGGALRIDDGSGNHSGFSFSTVTGLTQTNNNLVTLLGGLQVQSTAGNNSYFVGTGNVGIGTTNPTAKLHVTGSTGGIFEVDGANSVNALYVSASGNVGVGTTSPLAKLEVTSGNIRLSQGQGGVGSFGRLEWQNTLAYSSTVRAYIEGRREANDDGFIDFATSPNTNVAPSVRMTIDNNGNVGIGTTSPSNKLQIQGNVSASSYTSSISNAVGFLGTASFAVSASRASSSAAIDVLSGGSTTGLGIYSGSFSGSFFGALTGTGGGSGVGFPFSGSAVITGSLLVSSSGITLLGTGLTGSVFGTSSWAQSSSVAISASYALSSSFAVSSSTTVTSSFAITVGTLGAVTASSIVVTSSFGQLFTSSSASVSSGISRSFTDTGLFANQIGNHAIYEMHLAWDPNVQGSIDYRHVVIGDIIVMTNWNGTDVTSYIGYNERYALSSGSIGVQTGSVDVLWVSSSGEERRDCPVRSSTNQIRIKYDGFTLNRPEQNLRLTRKL